MTPNPLPPHPQLTEQQAVERAAHQLPVGAAREGVGAGVVEDGGLRLDKTAALCTPTPGQVAEHAQLLIAADWLTEADTAGGTLRGQLTERILPLGGLL